MVNVAGGKLTGFRRMAEDIVDLVAKELRRVLPEGPGTTPVPGGDIGADLSAMAADLARSTGVDRSRCERLVRLYGSESAAVIELGPDPVVEGGSVLVGELDWAIKVEAALRLEDVIYRRTRVAWYAPSERDRLVEVAAAHMAGRLGWDADRTKLEIATVRQRFADETAFRVGAER